MESSFRTLKDIRNGFRSSKHTNTLGIIGGNGVILKNPPEWVIIISNYLAWENQTYTAIPPWMRTKGFKWKVSIILRDIIIEVLCPNMPTSLNLGHPMETDGSWGRKKEKVALELDCSTYDAVLQNNKHEIFQIKYQLSFLEQQIKHKPGRSTSRQ